MRELDAKKITEAVRLCFIEANHILPPDLAELIKKANETESEALPRDILNDLLKNLDAAKRLNVPICQDTGVAVVFLKIGQDLHITGGGIEDAVNDGVKKGFLDGYLRASMVADPLCRTNTGDNTPAIIHTELVKGDTLTVTVAPKGFGSENMSAIKMLNPTATAEEVMAFVCDTVRNAGANPCPPIVLGVGIGGDFELCALLAKKALCRPVSISNPNPFYAALEAKMLTAVNLLHVGVQGFGGDTTALAVNIEQYATHIAGLPVAVNIGCHVTRHKTVIL